MIYVIRHGETDWNLECKMQGHTDIPLNKTGILQAQTEAREIAKVKIDHIYSSDLQRARQTAEIINKEFGLEVKLDKRIRESCFGDLEGRDYRNVDWEEFNSNPKKFNGETVPEVYSRVKSLLDEIKSKNLENVLLVTHAGTVRMLLYCADHNELDESEFANTYRFREIKNSSLIRL